MGTAGNVSDLDPSPKCSSSCSSNIYQWGFPILHLTTPGNHSGSIYCVWEALKGDSVPDQNPLNILALPFNRAFRRTGPSETGSYRTSISSLYLRRGASMMLRSLNVSASTSKPWPVSSVMRRQWRGIMALFVISSSRGQHSLNSSMVFFRSRKACHSFRARGSLRQLQRIKMGQFLCFCFTEMSAVQYVCKGGFAYLISVLYV